MDLVYSALILAQDGLGGGGPAPLPGAGAGNGAVAPGAGGGGGGGMMNLVFIGLMLVVFYFLLIRPQQKRAKKHRELIGALKKGDTVITTSGIYGRIIAIEDQAVTLEIAKNTKIKILRNYVTAIATPESEKELAASTPQ